MVKTVKEHNTEKAPKVKKEKQKKNKSAVDDYITDKQFRKPDKNKGLKVIIIVGLCLLLLIAGFAAIVDSIGNSDSSIPESIMPIDSRKKNLTKGNGLVAFTVPADYIDGNATEELTGDQTALGFTAATINDDGSVTYTMQENAYKAYKKQVEAEARTTLDEIVMSGKYIAIREISYNDNLTEVTVTVNKNNFESSSDKNALIDSFSSVGYMMAVEGFTSEGIYSSYKLIDNANSQVYSTIEFPAALKSNS